MEGSVNERIASLKPFSTKTERVLIEKLEVFNFNEIIYMSITELSMRFKIAEATILRFCKKLGYKGFQDFKLAISKELGSDKIDGSDHGEQNNILEKILSGIDFTCKNLNNTDCIKAAEMIYNASRISIFGVGNSGVSTKYFELSLLKLGICANNSSDSHLQTIFASNFSENDVVILVSVSGSTIDIINFAQICKKRNVPIIVITNYGKSPLAKYADLTFISSKKEAAYEGGTSASIVSQIYIFDLIYQELLNIYRKNNSLKHYNGSIDVSDKAI